MKFQYGELIKSSAGQLKKPLSPGYDCPTKIFIIIENVSENLIREPACAASLVLLGVRELENGFTENLERAARSNGDQAPSQRAWSVCPNPRHADGRDRP